MDGEKGDLRNKTGGDKMAKKMSKKDASRIQSHSDKTGKNQGFKSRAQNAASKNKGKK